MVRKNRNKKTQKPTVAEIPKARKGWLLYELTQL
jgi:hypothetical protein